MNGDQLRKLKQLRYDIRGSGCFAFEKDGTFFLYREVRDGANQKVMHSKNIDDFVRRACSAAKHENLGHGS